MSLSLTATTTVPVDGIAAAVGDRVRELRPCRRVGADGHAEREAEHLFDLDALDRRVQSTMPITSPSGSVSFSRT